MQIMPAAIMLTAIYIQQPQQIQETIMPAAQIQNQFRHQLN
jgi:hypothetical protein